MEELEKVRQEGWALDDQENEIEGRCIGAAMARWAGRVTAALSISDRELHPGPGAGKPLVPALKVACAEISRMAG